jgi:hypothetical protein
MRVEAVVIFHNALLSEEAAEELLSPTLSDWHDPSIICWRSEDGNEELHALVMGKIKELSRADFEGLVETHCASQGGTVASWEIDNSASVSFASGSSGAASSSTPPKQSGLRSLIEHSRAAHIISRSQVQAMMASSGLNWENLHKNYREDDHLALSLLQPATKTGSLTAKTHRADSLEKAAEWIAEYPEAPVVIGDVHGNIDLFRSTLQRLGVIDQNGRRTGKGEIIQLGDLIDGRSPQDEATLQASFEWCDTVLVGNHDAAYLNGLRFNGMMERPELSRGLRGLSEAGILQSSMVREGWLLSHAGVASTVDNSLKTPQDWHQAIDYHWKGHLQRSQATDPFLFGVDSYRGGFLASGGVFWGDWKSRLQAPPAFGQICGHTPLGGSEEHPDSPTHCLDMGGERLGVGVLIGGKLRVAHSLCVID